MYCGRFNLQFWKKTKHVHYVGTMLSMLKHCRSLAEIWLSWQGTPGELNHVIRRVVGFADAFFYRSPLYQLSEVA